MASLHEHVDQLLRRQLDADVALPDKLNLALRLLAKYRATLLQNTVVQQCGTTVQSGPFAGMRFVAQSTEGCHVPKLLGCYEAELHPHIVAAAGRGYDAVINIGAAEGYYAVGLARLLPAAQVYAYDTNAASHAVCRAVAESNGVADRIIIGSTFHAGDFETFAGQRTLVVCDIEGGETTLLDPERNPALHAMDLIVELHDGPQAKPSALIPERFAATHDITMVRHAGHEVALPALFEPLGHLDQLLAVWEWRSAPTPWAVMLARNSA
ncbi:MAG TPA: class I SAM-dependent methyltransferase [Acetobacteraceae bacterium]|nr:class I SAM-dependent methyltransferase [Acetobacteraceae bacterium]